MALQHTKDKYYFSKDTNKTIHSLSKQIKLHLKTLREKFIHIGFLDIDDTIQPIFKDLNELKFATLDDLISRIQKDIDEFCKKNSEETN